MTTSVADLTSLDTATRLCDCGESFEVVRLPGGGFVPHRCPKCIAARQEKPGVDPDAIYHELERAGVNVNRFRDATLSTFDDSHDPEALEAANAYIESWPTARWAPRDWMFLYGAGSESTARQVNIGAVGNGKTHLGIAIARRLIESGKLHPESYHFTTVERFLLRAEATFRDHSGISEDDLLARYEKFALLHLDDLGVRQPSPHAVRMLDELAKAREGRATIWTSNLSPKLIAEQHPDLKRIVSRLAGECGDGRRFMVAFHGPDRRVQRSQKAR